MIYFLGYICNLVNPLKKLGILNNLSLYHCFLTSNLIYENRIATWTLRNLTRKNFSQFDKTYVLCYPTGNLVLADAISEKGGEYKVE